MRSEEEGGERWGVAVMYPETGPERAEIVLATVNARFIHAAVGLRYLYANLGELQGCARILEFDLKQGAEQVVEEILARGPVIVGLGVYIWNAVISCEIVRSLKRRAPEVRVVLGGPEVSFEWESQEIVRWADHLITGEADLAFAGLCRRVLGGEEGIPKVIGAGLPDLGVVVFPYEHYTAADLRHRVLYVEASRGCPFTCEFCLSSLDVPVRSFPLERFLEGMEGLLERGARVFKFVDRTFNLSQRVSRAIVAFFRERWREGMFLHFEMVPDRMPLALMEDLGWFPAGAVQLEVGIQTFDLGTATNIRRRQDYGKLEANLRYLRERTGVHIHADLIVGLPGETWESFGCGFDRLVAMGPQEIQVGMLKRLRGTPIVRHDEEYAMRYCAEPPYEILSNRDFSEEAVMRMRRFAKYWDLVANSGRFRETLPRLWEGMAGPFVGFMAFSDWLGGRLGRLHSIPLADLAEQLFRYLEEERGLEGVEETLLGDWFRGGIRRERLPFMRERAVGVVQGAVGRGRGGGVGGERQRRHMEG